MMAVPPNWTEMSAAGGNGADGEAIYGSFSPQIAVYTTAFFFPGAVVSEAADGGAGDGRSRSGDLPPADAHTSVCGKQRRRRPRRRKGSGGSLDSTPLAGVNDAPPEIIANIDETDTGQARILAHPAWQSGRLSELTERLQKDEKKDCQHIVEALIPEAHDLALSPLGSRLVQEAIQVASGPRQSQLLAALCPHVESLYQSPHANHVLTKAVEVMPSSALGPLIDCLRGRTKEVARHRYGCRVLERLMEHCSEAQLGCILDEAVPLTSELCRHAFGNFVIQHVLEFGSATRRRDVLVSLLPILPELAMHRTASHVVQRTLDHCDEAGQAAVVKTLMEAASPCSLPKVACSRYGSFVVEQLAGVHSRPGGDEVRKQLSEESVAAELAQSPFGRRVLERFGLIPPQASA